MSSSFGAHARGFSLLEVILAIVVISVAVAGVVRVFDYSVRHSADPVVQKQMLMVAEELLEEIELKRYTSGQARTLTGCERSGFSQVSHYNTYATTNQVCDVDGTAIADLAGYSVSVTVAAPPGADAAVWGAMSVQQITVTVSRGTTDAVTVTGWRTDYAGP